MPAALALHCKHTPPGSPPLLLVPCPHLLLPLTSACGRRGPAAASPAQVLCGAVVQGAVVGAAQSPSSRLRALQCRNPAGSGIAFSLRTKCFVELAQGAAMTPAQGIRTGSCFCEGGGAKFALQTISGP